MSYSYGYTGKILWINLTTGKIQEEFPSEEIYRSYLGGYGLGVYYIYSRIKPHCDPLGPDNILGSRWMGFDLSEYGIHGTTEPETLGQQITQGCVRMSNAEVKELFAIIPVGTEVTVVD